MIKTKTLKQFGIEIPEAEYAPPGHTACGGCPGAAMLRQILKFLGPKVIMTNPELTFWSLPVTGALMILAFRLCQQRQRGMKT